MTFPSAPWPQRDRFAGTRCYVNDLRVVSKFSVAEHRVANEASHPKHQFVPFLPAFGKAVPYVALLVADLVEAANHARSGTEVKLTTEAMIAELPKKDSTKLAAACLTWRHGWHDVTRFHFGTTLVIRSEEGFGGPFLFPFPSAMFPGLNLNFSMCR